MVKSKKVLMMLLGILSVFLFGCSDSDDSVTSTVERGVSVTLPTVSNARAIYYTLNDVQNYTVSVKKGSDVLETKDANPGETVQFLLPDSGTYSIEVDAKNSDSKKIAGGSNNVTFAAGETGIKPVEIIIVPVKKVVSFNVSATWDSSDSTKYIASDADEFIVSVYKDDKLFDTKTFESLPKDKVIENIVDYGTYKINVIGRKTNETLDLVGQGEKTIVVTSTVKEVENIEIEMEGVGKESDVSLRLNLSIEWPAVTGNKFNSSDASKYEVTISTDGAEPVNKTYESLISGEVFDFNKYGVYTINVVAKNSNNTEIGNGQSVVDMFDATPKSVTVNVEGKDRPAVQATMVWVNAYDGTKVNFGEWPKSVANGLDETALVATEKFYDGYPEYKDAEGNRYVKVTSVNENERTLSDGSRLSKGNVRYFKVEPIVWKVISSYSDGRKVLMCDYIFNSYIKYYGYASMFDAVNDYERSNIRGYLNSTDNVEHKTSSGCADYTGAGFYEIAFSESDKAKIITNNITTNKGDKVTLLTMDELKNPLFGFDNDDSRCLKPTDYALARNGNNDWWTSTPESGRVHSCHYVKDSGTFATRETNDTNKGYVPVIVIKE